MRAYSFEGLSWGASLVIAMAYFIAIAVAFWCMGRFAITYYQELWRERHDRPERDFWLASLDAGARAWSRHLHLLIAFLGIWWGCLLGTILLVVLYGEPSDRPH
jgi:hypothetical protein